MTVLKTKLSRLLPKERKILQCLSIFWEQITSYEFKTLVDSMGIRSHQGEKLSAQYISVLENSMVKKQLFRSSQEYWGKGFQIFDSDLKEHLTREVLDHPWFAECVQVIQKNFPLNEFSQFQYAGTRYKSRLLRDLRIGIYQNNSKQIKYLSDELKKVNATNEYLELMSEVFANPFQWEMLSRFDEGTKTNVISTLLQKRIEQGEDVQILWDFVKENNIESELIEQHKADSLFYAGKFTEVKKIIGYPANYHQVLTRATIALLEGNPENSIPQFELAIAMWRKSSGKRTGFPDDWRLFLYSLAIYKQDDAQFYLFASKLNEYSAKAIPLSPLYRAVNAFECFLKNQEKPSQDELNEIDTATISGKILQGLASLIIPSSDLPIHAEDFASHCEDLGYKWLQLETCSLLQKKGRVRNSDLKLEELEKELGIKSISNLIAPIENWQRVLNAIKATGKEEQTDIAETTRRIAWRLDFARHEIKLVQQKYSRSRWTKGRKVPYKDLKSGDVELSDQDKIVIQSSMETSDENQYFSSNYYRFDWEEAVMALVGHPHVYLISNPTLNIELVKSDPNLVISEIDDSLELYFDTDFHKAGCLVKKETETRFRVIEITEYHVNIADSFNSDRVTIPKEGRSELVESIKSLPSKISIQSDLEEHFEDLPSVESDSRIYVLITSIGEDFHIEFFVKPFGQIPPYFKPGDGVKSLAMNIDGIRTKTRRNLEAERKTLKQVEELCPSLAELKSFNHEWRLSGPEPLLRALVEMEIPRDDGKLVIEWTKKQKLKLLGKLNFSDISLNVKGSNDWFKVSGSVKLNNETVMSMQELTRRMDEGSSEFIELTDGNFIAITDQLRKHLYSLNAVTDNNQRLHKLRSSVLQDFFEEVKDFKVDKTWTNHIAAIEAGKNYQPKLPDTFVGQLRRYQTKGYFWLSRLAKMGIGACLADDMGLGKTLQALAVMDERSSIGPALIVAPVSVCRNWVNEAKRFAPKLNLQIFGEGDRVKMVTNLGKNDVIVTSYSLLQMEQELFINKDFATITLDEAQAIKNSATKRSKTVMKLKGGFRLVTTGTPIENHLTELWSLFNFINPGLLGSNRFFRKKFAVPIQKDNDELARTTLQKLIKPYILRRRKDEVLKDLPEKTEITLMVQMSEEERAFYEAIRRDAIEKLDLGEGGLRDKRFQIFAELMRLRQASCNPRLVNPDAKIKSSKLDLFGRVLEEILDNEHKVLVFSQFVKHLSLVEEFLKKKKIQYHYLDGQTPAHLRQKQIDAFQDGEKSVFLISLKAGGTGLNLTEADYVIHLDPWWNPAVEDQATDRVHRIGQKRPVTVYRLVTEDSVEEKIVNLHKTKRDLADSLLIGTDTSGKLSADDLFALISEG